MWPSGARADKNKKMDHKTKKNPGNETRAKKTVPKQDSQAFCVQLCFWSEVKISAGQLWDISVVIKCTLNISSPFRSQTRQHNYRSAYIIRPLSKLSSGHKL